MTTTKSDDLVTGREAIERQAMAWVTRLTSGEATAADAEALNRWRAESHTHRRAFAEANQMWDRLGLAAREVRGRDNWVIPLNKAARPDRRLGRRSVLGGTIAASVAAAGYVMVRPPLDLWPSVAELTADYRTGKGEQRRIAIATASVQLNTQTSVALRAGTNGAGGIELISGEAAIATAGSRTDPFVVVARDGRAMATDARFNVRLEGSTVRVTCLEGAVQVECHGRAAKILAKQQIAYGVPGLSQAAAIDPEDVTAWQRGLLAFRYVPFARVIEEINRYRQGWIIVTNPELGNRSVVANFRLDRIDEVVDDMARAFGAHVTTLPGGVVLLS
jgi:transmembrane sensor